VIDSVTLAEAQAMADAVERRTHQAARRRLIECLELLAPETSAEMKRHSIITRALYEDTPIDVIRQRLAQENVLIQGRPDPVKESAVNEIYARRAKASEAAQ
jgi:hypothetical protein